MPALTARRLGVALGCEAMSVYHHFRSRRRLLDALVEHVLASVSEPPASEDPIARLRFIARQYRAAAHRYPKLFPLVALHRLNTPAGVAFLDRILGHFRAAQPDARLAAQAFRILGYYVIGAALDETSEYAAGPSAAEPVTDEHVARECPALAAAAPYFKRPYFDSTFELGLEMMLDGIARLAAAPRSRRAVAAAPLRAPRAVRG